MKLAEILSGPETWCQGAYTIDHRRCLIGALAEISNHTDMRGWYRDTERLRTAIGGLCPIIAEWNDTPGRTWDEVAAVVETYDRLTLLESQ